MRSHVCSLAELSLLMTEAAAVEEEEEGFEGRALGSIGLGDGGRSCILAS